MSTRKAQNRRRRSAGSPPQPELSDPTHADITHADFVQWERELHSRLPAIARTLLRAATDGLTAYGACWVPQNLNRHWGTG